MENKLGMFLMGLGIGAAAAVLLAPQSGEEVRGMISGAVDDGKKYLKKQRDDLGNSADDLIGKGKEALNRQRENINEAMEAGKQAYHEKVSAMPDARPV